MKAGKLSMSEAARNKKGWLKRRREREKKMCESLPLGGPVARDDEVKPDDAMATAIARIVHTHASVMVRDADTDDTYHPMHVRPDIGHWKNTVVAEGIRRRTPIQ
jgi:hypothetical protein